MKSCDKLKLTGGAEHILTIGLLPQRIILITKDLNLFEMTPNSLEDFKLHVNVLPVKLDEKWPNLHQNQFFDQYERNITNSITLTDLNGEYVVFYTADERLNKDHLSMAFIGFEDNAIPYFRSDLVRTAKDFQSPGTKVFLSSYDQMNLYVLYQDYFGGENFSTDHYHYSKGDLVSTTMDIEAKKKLRPMCLIQNTNTTSVVCLGKTSCANSQQLNITEFKKGFASKSRLYIFTEQNVWILAKSVFEENEGCTTVTFVSNEKFFDCVPEKSTKNIGL